MTKQFICQFVCKGDLQIFYWEPFETYAQALEYSAAAKKQALDYYGHEICLERNVLELATPLEHQ